MNSPIVEIDFTDWQQAHPRPEWTAAVEAGRVLYFPHLAFEVLPGLPSSTAVPAYAGLPLGSAHTVADVRGDVDWAALAAAPGPLILQAGPEHLADAARTLHRAGDILSPDVMVCECVGL